MCSSDLVPNSQPGVYLFCMGFEGLAGQSFQGLAGAFAKVRLELSSSSRAMQERVLAQALTCDQFRNPSRVGREIKIPYLIYFKRANDPNGVFKKSGSRIYSQ